MPVLKNIKITAFVLIAIVLLLMLLPFVGCENSPKRVPVDMGTPPVVDMDTTTTDKPDGTGREKDLDKDTVKIDPPKIDPPKKKPKDYSFRLEPEKYGIIQGKTDDAQALLNRFALEKALNEAAAKKCDTFFTGPLDAYFDVNTITDKSGNFYRWIEAINIPAGLIVNATGATLRVQPNNAPSYALFCMFKADNAQLLGGTIIGERNAHTYSGTSTDEWGHCLDIQGSQNVLIDGMTFREANGDGVDIHARGHAWEETYTPCRNVTVRNCKMIENRRQGISVTDGYGILIEKNLFLRTGVDTPTSKGTMPLCAIDVEADQKRDKETQKLIYEAEIVDGVIIRNNTEYGSANVAFNVHTGYNVLIESNQVETGIVYQNTHGTTIRNNRIVDTTGTGRVGIGGGAKSIYTDNNEVYGNYISGYEDGISLNYANHNVHDNKIENCRYGLRLHWVSDSKIYQNRFSSDLFNSNGILSFYRSLNNVTISKNYFESVRNPIRLINVNYDAEEAQNSFTVIDNEFVSGQPSWLENTKNATFSGNTFSDGVVLKNSQNITFKQNRVNAKGRAGFQIRTGNQDIDLTGNIISSDRDCVDVQEKPKNFTDKNSCQ